MKSKMEMTSYERVAAAFQGLDYDVYPAITPTSIATTFLMKSTNAFFPAAHTNPVDMATLAEGGYTIYGFDSIAPYFSIHLEASALGAKVNWIDGRSMPIVVQRSISDIDDFEVPKNFINRPEIQNLLKTISILKRKYKGQVPIFGKVVGPWSLAYNVYGVENLILDSILNPEKVSNLIEKLSVVPITFAQLQFDAGIDYLTWAEHVTADLVSPAIYKEFVLPVHRKASLLLNRYGPTIMHVCGNVMDRLVLFSQNGMTMLHLDSRNDPCKAMSIVKKTKLTGFVNNPVLLLQGKPSDVQAKVVDLLNQGVTFVSPECAIPFNVPSENLITLTKTIHSFSPRYAL